MIRTLCAEADGVNKLLVIANGKPFLSPTNPRSALTNRQMDVVEDRAPRSSYILQLSVRQWCGISGRLKSLSRTTSRELSPDFVTLTRCLGRIYME